MKNNKFTKQIMDKPFKYQRSSLNITILNVRSGVLFSKFIDVVLKWITSLWVQIRVSMLNVMYEISCIVKIELPPFEFQYDVEL